LRAGGGRSRGAECLENSSGTTIWETVTGCKIKKKFAIAETKYVTLSVRDADGDTNASRKSFAVARGT
jgi:hypothetical protein